MVAGVLAAAYRHGRRVDWPVVWMRAKWLTHHTKRLYSNLSEQERREFMAIVVPTKDARLVAKEDRARVIELVTKALKGPGGTTD